MQENAIKGTKGLQWHDKKGQGLVRMYALKSYCMMLCMTLRMT